MMQIYLFHHYIGIKLKKYLKSQGFKIKDLTNMYPYVTFSCVIYTPYLNKELIKYSTAINNTNLAKIAGQLLVNLKYTQHN